MSWLTKAKQKKLTCSRCSSELVESNFYISKSDLYKHYGRITVCKKCIIEIFNKYMEETNDRLKSTYLTCRKLDVVFSWSFYNGAIKQIESKGNDPDSMFGVYITKVNSLGGVNSVQNGFDNSDTVDISDNKEDDSESKDEKKKERFVVMSEEDIATLEDFWGKAYDYDELEKLQRTFEDFINNYECDTPVQTMLFKNIAKTQLNADKALAEGNVSSFDKANNSLSRILNDANIKPIQHSGAMASDQVTFGNLIKKYENDKPIPNPLQEWKDNNMITRYISTWFFGHLAKVMGVENKYKDLYEEETSKHSVDPNMNEDDFGDFDG